jgi:hypothetical protein
MRERLKPPSHVRDLSKDERADVVWNPRKHNVKLA